MKREQGLLIATIVILGLMTWSLFSSEIQVRKVRGARAMEMKLEAAAGNELVITLASGDVERDALTKPRTDFPLPTLKLPMPPLNGLPVLLPPPVPDSGPNYWSDYLYRYPEVRKGALNDLVDDSSTGLVLDDPDESEDGSSGDEANPLDEGLIDQDPSAQYAMLYDTVRLDAVRTLYGWILDENRYEIASGSPIQFQQIRPETGEEIFAPRNFERGDYQSFSFAKNLRNEIELGVREMRNSGAGDTEALREYVLWLLNNAIPEIPR